MHTLGNVGKTVFYTDPVDANPVNQTESMKDLVADMHAGKVDLLIILGGNPAYDAPADLDFAERSEEQQSSAARASTASIRTKPPSFASGTSMQAHELEAWGDARAYDGTVEHHPAADCSALQRQERTRIRCAAFRSS